MRPNNSLYSTDSLLSNWADCVDTILDLIGKRYVCTKAGEGTVTCCEKEMTSQEPRPLPSSD